MGTITDYFLADSDESAAATLGWSGGPAGSPAPPKRKGRFRRSQPGTPIQGGPSAGTSVLAGNGIEPVVMMATLEAQLTGTLAEQIIVDRPAAVIASGPDGLPLIVRLSQTLLAALISASEPETQAAAQPWSETEEFGSFDDPDLLAEFITELSALARQARDRGVSVYCWWSL